MYSVCLNEDILHLSHIVLISIYMIILVYPQLKLFSYPSYQKFPFMWNVI
jgi:hypothetical protein